MARKKVFVTGCFDMLHSGHVRFLEEAASHGTVYVGLGSDRTVMELKGRPPLYTEQERKYLIESLKHVKACFVNSGSGIMDFLAELNRVNPDIFVVNEDGNTPAKAELCRKLRIRYLVLKRTPRDQLPARSTTSLRKECRIPYRLDLAGGWLDQPFVSRHAAGPVLTISIEPTMEFNERSGLASSTRHRAIELWQTDIPSGAAAKLARILFAYENPPGTTQFSGSQDSIGIVFPGLNRLDYSGDYWPGKITSVSDAKTLDWLEAHLSLVPLGPRRAGFNVFKGRKIDRANARLLATSADKCWKAILSRDLRSFGTHCRESFEAQIRMFPGMSNPEVRAVIKKYADLALGWKLSGAGGGGYLVLVADRDVPGAVKIKVRRQGV